MLAAFPLVAILIQPPMPSPGPVTAQTCEDSMGGAGSPQVEQTRAVFGESYCETLARLGQPIRVGGNIKAPVKVKDVRPVYPADAQASGIQGVVIIETLLDDAGKVANGRILRSVPMLDDAALRAVSQWQYMPVLLNGAPVPSVVTVTVNFTLQ